MRRFFSSLLAIAFVAGLSTSAGVAYDKLGNTMMGTTHKCPKGSTWVNGHMDKKTHKMTKGYCRKGKSY
jgi:hypothetical protein